PLGSRQVSDLVRWISLGAPWPETPAGATNVARSAKPSGAPGKQDGPWWAFQPLRRPAASARQGWGVNAIDGLIFAQLTAKGLAPNPPATPRELIRRIYFDLSGLPPSPEAV